MIEPLGYFEFLKLLKNAKNSLHRLRRSPRRSLHPKSPLHNPQIQHRETRNSPGRSKHRCRILSPKNNRRNTENAGKAKELEQSSGRRKIRGKNHKYNSRRRLIAKYS